MNDSTKKVLGFLQNHTGELCQIAAIARSTGLSFDEVLNEIDELKANGYFRFADRAGRDRLHFRLSDICRQKHETEKRERNSYVKRQLFQHGLSFLAGLASGIIVGLIIA